MRGARSRLVASGMASGRVMIAVLSAECAGTRMVASRRLSVGSQILLGALCKERVPPPVAGPFSCTWATAAG